MPDKTNDKASRQKPFAQIKKTFERQTKPQITKELIVNTIDKSFMSIPKSIYNSQYHRSKHFGSMEIVTVLKRHLNDYEEPLTKRLCLAEKVVSTDYIPSRSKDEVVVEWLVDLLNETPADSEYYEPTLISLCNCFKTLHVFDYFPQSLKEKTLQVLSDQLGRNEAFISCCCVLLENESTTSYFAQNLQLYFQFIGKLLSQLIPYGDITENATNLDISSEKIIHANRILTILEIFYNKIGLKAKFVETLIQSRVLELMFVALKNESLRKKVLALCQNIMFPLSKKTFYSNFLHTLIKKDNLDELLIEKGDNIKSIMQVLGAFFNFPKGRSNKDVSFLENFIDTFVYSYQKESRLIFAFYIIIYKSLNLSQTYLNPSISLPTISFDENADDVRKQIYLKSLAILRKYEIDLNIKLIESHGEKTSKLEIKKYFNLYLQAVTLTFLKISENVDVASVKIINECLKLDPNIVEPKFDKFLPDIMATKKHNQDLLERYKEMLLNIIEISFKLSKGITFIPKLLPSITIKLEALNNEQFELKQNMLNAKDEEKENKYSSKLLKCCDIFPQECADKFGKLSSELMLRQVVELFEVFSGEFQDRCVLLLEKGFVSPSIVLTGELLAAILCRVLDYCKMADQAVPLNVAEKFWSQLFAFEKDSLRKFGLSLLRLSYDEQLLKIFLRLNASICKIKLLNAQYGVVKEEIPPVGKKKATPGTLFDFSVILPCLNKEEWLNVASRREENSESVECRHLMSHLLLQKIIACDILPSQEGNEKYNKSFKLLAKKYFIDNLGENYDVLSACQHYPVTIFSNLNSELYLELSKSIINGLLEAKDYEVDYNLAILKLDAVKNDKMLMESILLESMKKLWKIFEEKINLEEFPSFLNASVENDFDFVSFVTSIDDVEKYVDKLSSIKIKKKTSTTINVILEILKSMSIQDLKEESQLMSIFALIALKKIYANSKSVDVIKMINQSCDLLLLNVFELSAKCPNIFRIYPVENVISFDENSIKQYLVSTKYKTSDPTIILQLVLEAAVKKVKTDSELIKNIVKIFLKHEKANRATNCNSVEYFNNDIFQFIYILLPIIVKERKAITTSAFRSILAELEEKLNKILLKSFRNVTFEDLKTEFNNDLSLHNSLSGSVIVEELSGGMLAILNATESYSLLLSRCCEANQGMSEQLAELTGSLEYFVANAITALNNRQSKHQHIRASLQLLNIVLRNKHRFATHSLFSDRDNFYLRVWEGVKVRLSIIMGCKSDASMLNNKRLNEGVLEQLGVTLKFVSELSDLELFNRTFAKNLDKMRELQTPQQIIDLTQFDSSTLSMHQTTKFIWAAMLKANVQGPKAASLSRSAEELSESLNKWLRCNFRMPVDKNIHDDEDFLDREGGNLKDSHFVGRMEVDGEILEIINCDLNIIAEFIATPKKIDLSSTMLDSIFELFTWLEFVLVSKDRSTYTQSVASFPLQSFFTIFESALTVINNLLMTRKELLEDRWPAFLLCYRQLVTAVCLKGHQHETPDKLEEEKFAELSHAIEKLTQSLVKRKVELSRPAAYVVADMCSLLERHPPIKVVRQHLENSVILLIQVSESNHAMAFLRRTLANSHGQITLNNLYTMYKRYHKYVGTS